MTNAVSDLLDFNFQHMVIPPEVDNPPSPSTDHSETLSDLYGDEPEVPWVDAIANNMPYVAVDDPEITWFTGAIAYLTCYQKFSEEQWSEFKRKFEQRVLRRWSYEAGLGADPDEMLRHWKMFWVEDRDLEGLGVGELRKKFKESVQSHTAQHQYPALNDFYLVDEGVIASLLEEPSEGGDDEETIPFIWVAHADPDIEPNAGDPDQYEGHYKLPIERVGEFWELVSIGHMNMAGFAPKKRGGMGGGAFDTLYR